ncbi:MAG: hypothetical protein ACYTKD_03825 [Planctomycetota bacterium]|jgi:hypothetical protein
MRSGQSLGRRAPEWLAPGALALAVSLAGCGASATANRRVEDLKIKRLLARIKCPRTTLTLKQLGETYSEDAWAIAKNDFEPVYAQITEADAFQWEYLREVRERRRGLFARQDRIDAAKRKKAKAAAEKQRRRKAKADARAAAEAKEAEAIENAELAPALTAPGAAPTPSE